MFRPLDAIFRLHKIDLEEKEYNIYGVAHAIYIVFFSSISILCNLKMASSGRNM